MQAYFLPDILKDLFVNEYQTQINNASYIYIPSLFNNLLCIACIIFCDGVKHLSFIINAYV